MNENRMDIIGQNGNDGQHYDEIDASLGDTEQEEMPPADPVLLAAAPTIPRCPVQAMLFKRPPKVKSISLM